MLIAGIIAYIAFIFAAFSLKPVREFSVLNWNPFLSFQFFAAAVLAVALLHLLKPWFERRVGFANFLAAVNLLFFAFLFSSPAHIFVFTGYFYLVHRLAVAARWKGAKAAALVLSLVPLLVSRSTKEIQFIGLSYITFRAFHMVMDKDRVGLPRLRDYFVFLTFFPAVMAGPIDRYQRFKGDLEKGYAAINPGHFAQGWLFVIFGLCQKFIFAETVHRFFLVQRPTGLGGRLVDMYAYSAFLYFDFAGYSAMAIGLGYMLGVMLPQNFDKPFLAKNPQEFWKRFHITLGDWLKDYFFLPIYKLSHSVAALKNWPLLKQNIALFMTFLLMGYWNGSQKQYILCGTLFGIYSAVHNSYVYWLKRKQVPDLFGPLGRFGKVLAVFLTLNAACFALYVFSGRLPL